MGLDRERIMSKVSYIRDQVSSIRDLVATKTRTEVLQDPWLVKGLKYSLQTAVEAMIDLAYHFAAKKLNYAPTDGRDAMRILAERGYILKDNLPVYTRMIGFRNRVVHGYQEVSPERVYEIARNELGDFDTFIQEVLPGLNQKD